MAVKDSAELAMGETYTLGDYSFRIERSAGTSPNYDKVEAICTKGGKNARKSIQIVSSTKIDGWYVEANETEASVYIITEGKVTRTFSAGGYTVTVSNAPPDIEGHFWSATTGGSNPQYADDCMIISQIGLSGVQVTTSPSASGGQSGTSGGLSYRTFVFKYPAESPAFSPVLPANKDNQNVHALWSGGGSGETTEELLVGRFAIEIKDAGGDGPGSDWDDPEDSGDPTYMLYVEVIGALSGRHNDPIVDPSYSYKPADKDTVKQYGCGGDGGHGGGGGAGASTVVVHKFATNQAGNKEITALARRHGYGSGGGKGGKGGDGCILVYY